MTAVFLAPGDKLVPGAREVLTDIFKSCLHSEQMLSLLPVKPTKVMEIYLSKEQINTQAPGNLLHTFFTHVRPPKKALEDQLTQVGALPCPWEAAVGLAFVHLKELPFPGSSQPKTLPFSPPSQDSQKIRGPQAEVRQEQIQQGGQRTAPREGCQHQAAGHQTSGQGEGCAEQRQVRALASWNGAIPGSLLSSGETAWTL